MKVDFAGFLANGEQWCGESTANRISTCSSGCGHSGLIVFFDRAAPEEFADISGRRLRQQPEVHVPPPRHRQPRIYRTFPPPARKRYSSSPTFRSALRNSGRELSVMSTVPITVRNPGLFLIVRVCPVSPMVRGDIAESFGKKLELGENDAVWRLSTRRHSLFIIMSLSSLTTLLCLWDQRINLSCRSGIQTRQNVFEPLAKADAVRFACCSE